MSSSEQAQPQMPIQPQAPTWAMLRTLSGIAMIAGFLVVMVYQWSKPIIEENKRIAIEKAVFRVIPGAASRKDLVLGDKGLFALQDANAAGETIYAAFDEQGKLRGVALEAAATGYQDVIRILYGYDPYCQCITGIKVLKMAETPGLGDKIAFDPDFLENFKQLDTTLSADNSQLENEIVAVKHGAKSSPWQIDSISGATISSKAIGRMLNESGQRMFPKIQEHISKIETAGGEK